MKLVIATPLYPPEIGGPATYTKLLEEGLPPRGVGVTLVKFSEVRHLPKIVRHFAYFFRARRALKSADILLALDPVSVGLPACLAALSCKKPFVVKIVGDYAWEQGRQRFGVTVSLDEFIKTKRVPFFVWLLRRVETGVARRARGVIVPSKYLREVIVAWGISPQKIHIIYNAAPIPAEVGTVPSTVEALPRPLVVSIGRLVPWKNIESVIDAVAMLRVDGIFASLGVVGDGPERARLATSASEALTNAYIFTGLLSHSDASAVLRSADVFVLNSTYEGLSHILIEALSLGVPIVATRAGGNAEVVTDEENGILVPVGDVQALARALARVLTDKAPAARLRRAAEQPHNRFSTDAMLDGTMSVLETIARL